MKNITVTYLITVSTEVEEIVRLLSILNLHSKRNSIVSETVLLYDTGTVTDDVLQVLENLDKYDSLSTVVRGFGLRRNFAAFKNYGNSLCLGDYIFQIDADEYPDESLLMNLNSILVQNPNIDLFLVPRVNKVKGLTEKHVKQWNWHIDDEDRINWPDYQHRLYRNSRTIHWQGNVHERIVGQEEYTALPEDSNFALHHYKTIEKQEKQNNFYSTL